MTKIVQFGNFTFSADPIFAADDSQCPGRLMGYRLKGPRGNKQIIAVDYITGQPDAREMARLALWVDAVNYATAKINAKEKKRIDRKVSTGKATRKDVLRGLDLLRKRRAVKEAV